MQRKIISILLICVLSISVCSPVLAVSSTDVKKQAENTKSQSDEAKEKLDNVEGQINTAMQEVEDLNSSIDTIKKEVESLSSELKSVEESLKDTTNDLDEKEELLKERLVASYMNQNNTYLDALFSGGLGNFVSNYESIKRIAEYDTNLMNEVKETKNNLETKKADIERLKSEKETKTKDLKRLKSEKETKVSNLTDEQKNIQSQIEEYDNQMKVLEQKEKELAAKEAAEAKAAKEAEEKKKAAAATVNKSNTSSVDSTSNGSNVTSTGSYQWPVPASHNITSKYGYRIHPISGTKKFHSGIDIGAPGGTDIVAADSGTVMLASNGYNGGYGNYIIINHGNGITTRYAHCSKLNVTTGQKVSKGQTIAAVGSTGSSTGNHLHFEIRINGESQNPTNYV